MAEHQVGQYVELSGKTYILIPEEAFERLQQSAVAAADPLALVRADQACKNLRDRRRRAGLTLAEVSRRAGIALETLSRIETGRSNPSLKTFVSILRALAEDVRA